MILHDVLEPYHGPVYFSTVFDLSGQELQQLEKEHFWHVGNDKGNRVQWYASVHAVCDLGDVESKSQDEGGKVFFVLNFGYDVIQSDALIDVVRVEVVGSLSQMYRI